ncbi:MAG: EAL domain-containing protein [Erysipelotrichia bacterium]|nr:EAL domain-containing protein [Erysipelotrichia bacterium]NCC54464.1 EAL domain-containing protein [Erysipelotrichia bacterium]
MEYNISYEVSALAFLLIIVVHFFFRRKYISLQGKIYSFYVLFIFFNIVTDIISTKMIASASQVPLVLNYIVNEVYICSLLCIPAIFYIYVLSLTHLIKKKILLVSSIPIIIGLTMACLNPFNELLFYFDEQERYLHGVANIYLYINALIYFMSAFVIIFVKRKQLKPTLFLTLVSIILMFFAGLVYQHLYPQNIIVGLGAVISQLLLYITMENPDMYCDSLTGVLNEEAMKAKVNTYYRQGKQATFVLISIRDLKMINDVFSRFYGDEVLKQIATYLIGESDDQSVFRINGDIFIVVCEDEDASFQLLHKILERLKQEWEINHVGVKMDASLAVMNMRNYQNANELFLMLEHVLVEMKKKGKKMIYVVDEEETKKLVRSATIQRALSDVIAKEKMEIAYQPLFDRHGKLRGLEALARLNLIKYGYVSPEEFIRLAETNGMILKLGIIIIKEVFTFMRENKKYFQDHMRVSINLSVIQIMKPMFAIELLALIDEYEINARNIVLEITESEAIYSNPTVLENLQLLHDANIELAMDDYGSGYANLDNMIDIPFKAIKLDKLVIWNSMHNRKARVILVNTVRMLQQLNFEIVAEGIESKEYFDDMKTLSFDLYQGYYFSKPLSKFVLWEEIEKIELRIQMEESNG